MGALPGLTGVIVGAGRAPVTSISFISITTSTAATITCPTVQADDIGVLFDLAESAPGVVIPSGFTQLTTDSAGALIGTVSYKVFNGTESGSTLTGQDGTADDLKILLLFRPNAQIESVVTSTWLGDVNINNPPAQSIAATGQPGPLIRMAAGGTNTTVPSFSSGTFTSTFTVGTLRVGYIIQNTSPTSDTVDIGDNGTNWLASGWLRVT